jgi:hypothetical protein
MMRCVGTVTLPWGMTSATKTFPGGTWAREGAALSSIAASTAAMGQAAGETPHVVPAVRLIKGPQVCKWALSRKWRAGDNRRVISCQGEPTSAPAAPKGASWPSEACAVFVQIIGN